MKHNNFTEVFLCFILLSLTTGCTHLINMSLQPTALSASDKLPLHVILVLNTDLVDYKYEFHSGGDTTVFPFGPALQDYARHVASVSFQQVDEASSIEKAFANSSADIVLIPRPVKAELGVGWKVQNPVNFIFLMEWTAKDRISQNTVWLKTITAEATDSGANLLTMNEHKHILMQKLFDDLSVKTYESFQKAPEFHGNLH